MERLLFILMIFACSAAAAGPNLEPVAREAHTLYVKFVKDIPFSMPEIEFVDGREMEEIACGGVCPRGLKVRGLYFDGVISLNNNMTFEDDWDRSFFVHEMIHYFQEVNKKFRWDQKHTCELRRKLELQAYYLQNQYLITKNKSINKRDFNDLVAASTGSCAAR